jgi:isopenicillin-N epimerase
MEREPVDFLARELPGLLDSARQTLAAFVGADASDLAFVPNATAGVNAIVRSLDWKAGDEILTTNHAYAACRKALEYVASRTGARVVCARIPFPLESADEILDRVLDAVTPATRLALLDHVSSPTALVFPIERLVAELSARGVDTLVDGAHAPGMVPLDLGRVGAAYYTGNAHKWLCAPKGAGFLHIRRDRQANIHPTTISHGYAPGSDAADFRAEFDWTGTADPTAFLSVAESIRFLGSLLPGGWPDVFAANLALALRAREILCETLGENAPCPESMIGSMASLPLPEVDLRSPAAVLDSDALAEWFRSRGVESWFYSWACGGGKVIRISAQLYNSEQEFGKLAVLLKEAMRAG